MITIRNMDEPDIEAILDVTKAALRWLATEERWTPAQRKAMLDDQTSGESIRKLPPKQDWLVACRGSEVLGVIAIMRDEIARLYVRPAHHRRGIGTALFAAAERHMGQVGFDTIRCRCFPASRPFYAAVGMSVIDREPCPAVRQARGRPVEVIALGAKPVIMHQGTSGR